MGYSDSITCSCDTRECSQCVRCGSASAETSELLRRAREDAIRKDLRKLVTYIVTRRPLEALLERLKYFSELFI